MPFSLCIVKTTTRLELTGPAKTSHTWATFFKPQAQSIQSVGESKELNRYVDLPALRGTHRVSLLFFLILLPYQGQYPGDVKKHIPTQKLLVWGPGRIETAVDLRYDLLTPNL